MLAEWHLSPNYIVDNWTDELLALMTEKLTDRMARLTGTKTREMKEAELFSKAGHLIKVVKKSGD